MTKDELTPEQREALKNGRRIGPGQDWPWNDLVDKGLAWLNRDTVEPGLVVVGSGLTPKGIALRDELMKEEEK